MKKKYLIIIASCLILSCVVQILSCKKDSVNNTQPASCNVKGSYAGTFANQGTQSSPFAYILSDNNFTYVGANLSSPPTAFGGYENNCDSITIRTWSSTNNSYYYFAGKFSNDQKNITGIYKNLTSISETGTFTLIKQ